jgi:hypothetical protein
MENYLFRNINKSTLTDFQIQLSYKNWENIFNETYVTGNTQPLPVQKYTVHTHTLMSLETLFHCSGSNMDLVSMGSSVFKTRLSGATCLSRVSAH